MSGRSRRPRFSLTRRFGFSYPTSRFSYGDLRVVRSRKRLTKRSSQPLAVPMFSFRSLQYATPQQSSLSPAVTELVLVRSMLRILVANTLVATQIAFATASDEFNRAAAQAAEKSKTSAGAQYPLKVAFSISHQVVEAMEDCRPDFPLGSTFDFVLIVSASGRIE